MPRTYHKPWRLAFVVRIGRDAGVSERPYKVEQWSKDFAPVINVILETNDRRTLMPNWIASYRQCEVFRGGFVFPCPKIARAAGI